MDNSTVLNYPNLSSERLEYWQKRAFREWALRPGPIFTFLRGLTSWQGVKSASDIALQHLRWIGKSPAMGDIES